MRILAALAMLLLPGPAQPPESLHGAPITSEEVLVRLEARRDYMELGLGEAVPPWNNEDADVRRVVTEIRTRLTARPQDTQALLSWARLLNPAGDKEDSLPTREAALDRVLAAEPHNAEALYQKGRTCGTPVWANDDWAKSKDLDQAVTLMRQAVKFAPDKARYRRGLASFLADQGHPGEARSTLSTLPKNDPMVRFLEELEAVPIPEGAEYFFDHSLRGGYLLDLADMDIAIEDYVHLRVRLYRILKSPAEIGAFYAARIPGFQFLRVHDDPPGAQDAERDYESEFAQFLRMKSGVMRPARTLRDIPHPTKRQPGTLMSLVETRKLGPAEHQCYLLLVNNRK